MHNCEALNSGLDLFVKSIPQTSITDSQDVIYKPTTTIDVAGPIEFNISNSGSEYIDTAKIYHYHKCRIVDENGAPFKAKELITVNNLIGTSMYSDLTLEINGA